MYGSLQNRIMDGSKSPEPVNGMGCTEIQYSDRTAYTVVKVLSPKKILVREDNAERTDSNGMSESQTYRFTQNRSNPKITLVKNRRGQWKMRGHPGGNVFILGIRMKYYDYSF